jgi:hypothetical protein
MCKKSLIAPRLSILIGCAIHEDCMMTAMAIPVVEISRQGNKIRKVFG